MTTITTSASFLERGYEQLRYAALEEVTRALVGQQIAAVEKADHNSITFRFVSGSSMTLTSSGLEGDDLDLVIETD